MPASFEDPPPDRPYPPPQPGIRDENLGTIFKIGGSGCVALCTCTLGVAFLLPAAMMGYYGGFFVVVGLVCLGIGCYSVYYGWSAADKGSQW
ncbi:MAG: hypothetical protein ACFFDQ_10870 [Candidatus Thorarchaeota archaeon]